MVLEPLSASFLVEGRDEGDKKHVVRQAYSVAVVSMIAVGMTLSIGLCTYFQNVQIIAVCSTMP